MVIGHITCVLTNTDIVISRDQFLPLLLKPSLDEAGVTFFQRPSDATSARPFVAELIISNRTLCELSCFCRVTYHYHRTALTKTCWTKGWRLSMGLSLKAVHWLTASGSCPFSSSSFLWRSCFWVPGMYLVFSAIISNGVLDMLTWGKIARHSLETGQQCRNAVRTRSGRGIQQSSRITQKLLQKVAIKLQLLS